MTDFPVFDGHNDLILRLLKGDVTADGVALGLADGHIDKPRAIKGGFGGGMFAIYAPSPYDRSMREEEMQKPSCLLEHVAGRIGRRIFSQLPLVEAIDISVAKINPPMGADIGSASVELHLINDKTI